jgi:hypothetical protein
MLAEENDQEPLREALAVAKHVAGPGDVPMINNLGG